MKTKILFIAVLFFSYALLNASYAQQLTADAGADQTICTGMSATLGGVPAASGGTEPYTYSWTPAGDLSNAAIANPFAFPTSTTTYTLQVTDASMSTATDNVTITVTPPPVANAGNDVTICAGTSATLTASGGTNYQWSNGSASASITVSPATTTTYIVTVSIGSCTATDDVTVFVGGAMGITITSTNETCGHSNGTLTAITSGGIAPYMYQWSTVPMQYSQTATNLPAGTYTVTVIDASGCTGTNSATVLNLPGPTVITTAYPSSCGLCNGSATASSSGGSAPFSYLWSNGSSWGLNSVCPGTYYVTVTDVNACTATGAAVITNVDNLAVIMDTISNANCTNNNLGSISVHGDCGTAPYLYQWSTGETTSSINDLVSGVYSVTVTDANSDTAVADFPISNTANIYASVTTTIANCSNNGTATVNVFGVWPPYTYEWSDAQHQTTATATGLTQGQYWVTVTDSIGCTLIASCHVSYLGCMNVIKGRVYLDSNQNCIQDPGETGIANKMLHVLPSNHYGSTDLNGDFTILTPDSNNMLYAPTNMQAPFSLTCPVVGYYYISFTQQGDSSLTNDFGYYSDPDYFDLSINPIGSNSVPGFTKRYWIYYLNNSLLPKDVLIRLTYDTLMQYDSCTPGGVHYPAQHKIEWIIYNVPPGINWNWSQKTEAFFYIQPFISLGTMLGSCFEIFPVVGDANQVNNTKCLEEIVTGSMDPNSKDVSPVGLTEEGFITANDSTLNYTIHFQNTGTDTAFTVVVVDTLSPYLNPASIIPGAASHPYTFNLSGQGILAFRFDNILLPDSNVNEPASNGYVSFSVNQKQGNTEGTVITNLAANYFDFNLPVNTNTVKNTIGTPEGITEEVLNPEAIIVYPIPANDAVNIEILSTVNYPCYLKIYNEISCLVSQYKIAKSVSSVNCNNWESGFYFYTIEDYKGAVIGRGKMIIQ
ncbi:MAG: T9SS type A sorting domain-containing protein [Bacteroidota bacterium]